MVLKVLWDNIFSNSADILDGPFNLLRVSVVVESLGLHKLKESHGETQNNNQQGTS